MKGWQGGVDGVQRDGLQVGCEKVLSVTASLPMRVVDKLPRFVLVLESLTPAREHCLLHSQQRTPILHGTTVHERRGAYLTA